MQQVSAQVSPHHHVCDVPWCIKHSDVTGDSYLFGRAPRGWRNRSRRQALHRQVYYTLQRHRAGATCQRHHVGATRQWRQRPQPALAWSRPFYENPAARPASCQRDKPNLLELIQESATMADTMNEITSTSVVLIFKFWKFGTTLNLGIIQI